MHSFHAVVLLVPDIIILKKIYFLYIIMRILYKDIDNVIYIITALGASVPKGSQAEKFLS